MRTSTFLTAALAALASAWSGPDYPGYRRVWQDTFAGPGGSPPDANNWNTVTNIRVNNELQDYTTSTRNLQKSGGPTLQIVPWWEGNRWTSGRVESKYVFTPEPDRVTRVEAQIRFGPNDIRTKQGIWPAFWMLGDSIRRGVGWPACGEIDILETVNGILTGYGTIHCHVAPGGICQETNGIGNTIQFHNQDWHTWRVEIDRRRGGDWRAETLTWFMDGQQFHQVSGARINNYDVWKSLAQSPLFIILNVAVGGNWPGYPNGETQGGYGAMMEVGYVAHYVST